MSPTCALLARPPATRRASGWPHIEATTLGGRTAGPLILAIDKRPETVRGLTLALVGDKGRKKAKKGTGECGEEVAVRA